MQNGNIPDQLPTQKEMFTEEQLTLPMDNPSTVSQEKVYVPQRTGRSPDQCGFLGSVIPIGSLNKESHIHRWRLPASERRQRGIPELVKIKVLKIITVCFPESLWDLTIDGYSILIRSLESLLKAAHLRVNKASKKRFISLKRYRARLDIMQKTRQNSGRVSKEECEKKLSMLKAMQAVEIEYPIGSTSHTLSVKEESI